jgi:peptidoglycan/LPS O-acetylase OafA/YrhL
MADSDTQRTVPPASFGYRPALDGIRAFAVAAVVLFHAGVGGIGGGFLGVDTFFVLSGFLITSLLLAEHARTGSIRLTAFWARRARRLLPALLAMLAATVVAGHFLLDSDALGLLRTDALAALGYVANWRMIFRGTGYAAATAAPSPLQHTWSLGIEEQFYLLWPLIAAGLLALLAARRARWALLALCTGGAVASQVLCAHLYDPQSISRAYYGTDTRAQALLIGAALAAILAPGTGGRELRQHRPSRRIAPAVPGPAVPGPAVPGPAVPGLAVPGLAVPGLAVPGLAVLGLAGAAGTLWLWHSTTDDTALLYDGGLTVAALATALVIAHVIVCPRSVLARFLALTPLVWLGRISYGVYLWHWPLFTYVTADATGLSRWPLLAVRLAGTVGVAILSYVVIEQPIRRGALDRLLPRRVPVAVTAAATGLVAVVIGFATAPPPAPVPAAAPVVIPPAQPRTSAPVDRPSRARSPAGRQPRITFLGDSVSWVIGADLPAHPGLWTSDRAIQGCGIATLPQILELGTPHTNYPGCTKWPQRWQRAIDKDNPDVAAIELNRWELMDRKLNGTYQHVGEPGFDAYLMGQLDEAVRIANSRGAAVALLTAAYTHRAEKPDGSLYPEDQPQRVDAWNDLIRAEAAEHPGKVTVLDITPVVCPQGRFTWTIGKIRVRSDGLHYTPAAVQKIIAPWLLPKLAAIATGTYDATARRRAHSAG